LSRPHSTAGLSESYCSGLIGLELLSKVVFF